MKIERIKLELSQSRLADMVRSHQVRISRIERGARPAPEEAVRIAKALGLRPEDLFDGIVEARGCAMRWEG